ncbi:hypothetical protein [Xanthovirga aplysinae]|uniref:hypothetical protein n=1 Tax=Xanthovirga aplysinae TaxID=2529853 RepID=UPI001CA391D5|nr:hypothetical protein [Xanthovirga aplysinae]
MGLHSTIDQKRTIIFAQASQIKEAYTEIDHDLELPIIYDVPLFHSIMKIWLEFVRIIFGKLYS